MTHDEEKRERNMSKSTLDFSHDMIVCYDPEKKIWRNVVSGHVEAGKFVGLTFSEDVDLTSIEKYIIPGFIDAHCHLLEYPYDCSLRKEDRLLPNIALNNALEAARGGVTSLKDMGGYGYKAIEIIKMLVNFKTPRLFSSGCYFTVPGGHCSDHGAIEVDSMDAFVQSMKPLIANKIPFCKIINSDTGFELDLLSQMVQYAHSNGMIVSCHAYTEKAASVAVLAGTDTLEHAGDYSDELINLIKEKDIIVVPTYVAAIDSENNPVDLADVDETVIAEWVRGENTVIPKLFKRGIKVALGSDSGFLGTPCNSLLREIELLHSNFCIELSELLYSAYIITPLAVGMGNSLGKIESGYFADYLCYQDNPLDDIKVLMQPQEVYVNGSRVDQVLQDQVIIRRLTNDDTGSLASYLQHYYFDCAELDDFWTDDEINAWVNDSNDYCTGAFSDGKIVGFCLTHHHKTANKVHIENIWVDDSYRSQGVAQYLLFDVIAFYRSSFPKVRFVSLVDSANEAAIPLMLKNDFTKGHRMYWMQYNSYEQL